MGDITIKDLSFSYEEGGKIILEDIHTRIRAGEFVCVLGQSGCGKSTLLHLCVGGAAGTGRGDDRRGKLKARCGVPGLRAVSVDDGGREYHAGA